jgi:hypothetical protein
MIEITEKKIQSMSHTLADKFETQKKMRLQEASIKSVLDLVLQAILVDRKDL